MAIVTFWSNGKEETAKTLSIVSIATSMAIENNLKTLMLSTNYNDNTLESCFWKLNKNQKRLIDFEQPGKRDLDTGVEGLVKAVKSKRITPETISDYTKVVFKDRLDVLLSVKSVNYQEYERTREIYVELLEQANKYYDIVFVDLNKGLDNAFSRKILEMSDIIVVNLTQRVKIIEEYMEIKKKEKLFQKNNVMLLIGRYDKYSKYNAKNLARYMGERREISVVPYCTLFFEACNEAKTTEFFLKYRNIEESDRNAVFINQVKKAAERIIYKIQELKLQI